MGVAVGGTVGTTGVEVDKMSSVGVACTNVGSGVGDSAGANSVQPPMSRLPRAARRINSIYRDFILPPFQ